MKKTLLWILIFALICSFAGCANELREQAQTDEETTEPQQGTELPTQSELQTEPGGDSVAHAWHTEC